MKGSHRKRRRGEVGVTLTRCPCAQRVIAASCVERRLHTRPIEGTRHWQLGEDVRGLRGVFVLCSRGQQHGATPALRRGRGRRAPEVHLERLPAAQALRVGAHRGVHPRLPGLPRGKLAGWVSVTDLRPFFFCRPCATTRHNSSGLGTCCKLFHWHKGNKIRRDRVLLYLFGRIKDDEVGDGSSYFTLTQADIRLWPLSSLCFISSLLRNLPSLICFSPE